MRRLHWILALCTLAPVLVALVWAIGYWHDPRLDADAAERQLQARLGTGVRYACERTENDGTIELGDVDYVCYPADGAGLSYWIGTNRDGITGMQQLAP